MPFDLDQLEVTGTPVALEDAARVKATGAVDAVVSASGTLWYVRGDLPAGSAIERQVFWVDSSDAVEAVPHELRDLNNLSVSPVANRVAVESRDDEWDIWVGDLDRPGFDRLTFGEAREGDPLWTPDGQHIVFTSDRDGSLNLYMRRADGTGEATRLTESLSEHIATSISPDGETLVLTEINPGVRWDIGQIRLDQPGEVERILDSPFREQNGVVSPNGQWLAYQSDESGQDEVYVRAFSQIGPRARVSTEGGGKPMWSRDGVLLFFWSGDELHVASMDAKTGRRMDLPSLVLDAAGRFNIGPEIGRRRYDLSPDGDHFLMIGIAGTDDDQTAVPNIIVAQHWLDELARLAPAN